MKKKFTKLFFADPVVYKFFTTCLWFAAVEAGVNLKGYTAWSFMDNFEWSAGYTERFGIHSVNFTDPARPRTPKASATWYTELIKNNGWLPLPPDNSVLGLRCSTQLTSLLVFILAIRHVYFS